MIYSLYAYLRRTFSGCFKCLRPLAKDILWQGNVILLLAGDPGYSGNLPDLDVLMLRWFPYSHPLSHRGLSHSLLFALVTALCVTIACYLAGIIHGNFVTLSLIWLLLATVMASHGLLDALTDGGLGIGIFSPFDLRRYFFPIHPIPVASISPSAMFSSKMLHVYAVELSLFGPFCLSAWLSIADLSGMPIVPIFRWLAAVALFIIGIGAWIARV